MPEWRNPGPSNLSAPLRTSPVARPCEEVRRGSEISRADNRRKDDQGQGAVRQAEGKIADRDASTDREQGGENSSVADEQCDDEAQRDGEISRGQELGVDVHGDSGQKHFGWRDEDSDPEKCQADRGEDGEDHDRNSRP